jgi:hypothetical protein
MDAGAVLEQLKIAICLRTVGSTCPAIRLSATTRQKGVAIGLGLRRFPSLVRFDRPVREFSPASPLAKKSMFFLGGCDLRMPLGAPLSISGAVNFDAERKDIVG